MNIKEIAKKAIIELKLVSDKQVYIDKVTIDWKGVPEIYIITEASKPEGETQFGYLGESTLLGIVAIATTRQESWNMRKREFLRLNGK